jgi:hypothetical protein
MSQILSITITTLLICTQIKAQNKIVPVNFDTAYHPAVFTDVNRMDKIKKAFPVIDKIFKDQ